MSAENLITLSSDLESDFTEDDNGPSDDTPQVGMHVNKIIKFYVVLLVEITALLQLKIMSQLKSVNLQVFTVDGGH